MAESQSPPKSTSKPRHAEELPSELEFSNSVYGWARASHRKITDFLSQMTDPRLAVDAHVLQHLKQLQNELDQLGADLELHIPPDQRDRLIERAGA